MHGKKRTGTVMATEGAAQAALRRGPAPALAPDEDRVMRMRLGAALPLSARLERIATATDADIEVLAYEIDAFLRLGRRATAPSPRPTAAGPVAPGASRAKDKIVRALRKKR